MTAGSASASAGRRGLLLAAFIATTLGGCRAGGGVMTPGDATALPAATEASGLAGATVAAAGTPASGVQLSFIDHASFRKLDPDAKGLAAGGGAGGGGCPGRGGGSIRRAGTARRR